MHSLIDAIFDPVTTILQAAVNALNGAALSVRRGLDVAAYLGWVGYLPPGWHAAVVSLLTAAGLLGIVVVARAIYNVYLLLKEGVQWW